MEHKLLKKLEREEDAIIDKIHSILQPEKKAEAEIVFLGTKIVIKGKDYKKAFKRITDIARKYEKYLARVEIGEVTITDSKAINKLKKDIEKVLKGYKVYVNNDELVVEGKMAKITITNTWTISRASCLEDVVKEIRKEYLDKIRKEKIRCEKKWDVKIIIKKCG